MSTRALALVTIIHGYRYLGRLRVIGGCRQVGVPITENIGNLSKLRAAAPASNLVGRKETVLN